jgi:hypothetical protein
MQDIIFNITYKTSLFEISLKLKVRRILRQVYLLYNKVRIFYIIYYEILYVILEQASLYPSASC